MKGFPFVSNYPDSNGKASSDYFQGQLHNSWGSMQYENVQKGEKRAIKNILKYKALYFKNISFIKGNLGKSDARVTT